MRNGLVVAQYEPTVDAGGARQRCAVRLRRVVAVAEEGEEAFELIGAQYVFDSVAGGGVGSRVGYRRFVGGVGSTGVVVVVVAHVHIRIRIHIHVCVGYVVRNGLVVAQYEPTVDAGGARQRCAVRLRRVVAVAEEGEEAFELIGARYVFDSVVGGGVGARVGYRRFVGGVGSTGVVVVVVAHVHIRIRIHIHVCVGYVVRNGLVVAQYEPTVDAGGARQRCAVRLRRVVTVAEEGEEAFELIGAQYVFDSVAGDGVGARVGYRRFVGGVGSTGVVVVVVAHVHIRIRIHIHVCAGAVVTVGGVRLARVDSAVDTVSVSGSRS